MDTKIDISIFEFSAKFCNELDKTKNVAVSPLAAAEFPMAMMALGTFDSCSAVFSNTVQICNERNVPSSFMLLSPKLKSIKGVTLSRASKVYLNKNLFTLNRHQKKNAKDIFNVKMETIDFIKRADAYMHLNKWVEKKTKSKLKYFFSSSFNIDTDIVLVSGLYFKGIWQINFDPENTEEAIFYMKEDKTINIFLMYRKNTYKYKDCEDLDAQLVLLPFKDEQAHMLIVVPKRVNGLDKMLQKLADGFDLMAEMAKMTQNEEVELSIPRFKIESEINFSEVLEKLGIMTTYSRAVQKVLIEVSEEGMEPKAERVVGGFIPRWKPKAREVTADHPHLIVILCHDIPIIWVTFRGRYESAI